MAKDNQKKNRSDLLNFADTTGINTDDFNFADTPDEKEKPKNITTEKPENNDKKIDDSQGEDKLSSTVINKEKTNNEIIQNYKKKKRLRENKKLVGLYLEPDVVEVLDFIGSEGGRGAKSDIVNIALKKYFKEEDLL